MSFAGWLREWAGTVTSPRDDMAAVVDDLANLAAQQHEALLERPDEHDGGCSAGISKLACKCSRQDADAAIKAGENFKEKYE